MNKLATAALSALILFVPLTAQAEDCIPDGTNPACDPQITFPIYDENNPTVLEDNEAESDLTEEVEKQRVIDSQLQDLVNEMNKPLAPQIPEDEEVAPVPGEPGHGPVEEVKEKAPKQKTPQKAERGDQRPGLPKAGL